MLNTDLKHILNDDEFHALLAEHDNVMVCCGRMGPMCLPVYDVMEKLEPKYRHVEFRDMEFDAPVSHLIRNLPQCRGFNGLPFTVYFKRGRVVEATTSLQNKQQITTILDREFSAPAQEQAAAL